MKLCVQLSMLLFYLFIWSIPTIMLVFLVQHAVRRHDKGTTKFCHEIFNNSGSGGTLACQIAQISKKLKNF